MYIDGPTGVFTVPYFQFERQIRPIEGTEDLAWEETYVQLITYFVPMTYNTASTRHTSPTFYLIDETTPQPVGPENSPLVRYTRTFAALPATRIEKTLIAQQYLGISGGTGSAWTPYGTRKPFTFIAPATDTITYALTSTITIDQVTQSVFSANTVDYFGNVYSTVTPYSFLGTTVPLTEPVTYNVSCEITRWRGNIWQKTTRQVRSPLYI